MANPRLELFGRFAAEHLKTESGAPLVLEPFQRAVLTDYFAGTRELVTIAVKKSGKTSLVAAVALFELVTNPSYRIAVGANARDQALRTHQQATGFIRRSPWLHERLVSTRREIRSRRAEGLAEFLAADVDHLDGWIGHRAFIDELHRAGSIELYSILTAGVAPLGGQAWTFSTAGDDPLSPLGKIRQAAHELSSFSKDGPYSHARSNGFAYHELGLAVDEDYADMALVRQVHPSWVTEDDLRTAYESPTMTETYWRRFYAGQWVQGLESAVSAEEWRGAARPGLRIPDGARGVIVGVDIGRREDCTAVVAVHRDSAKQIRVEPIGIIPPPGDGTSTSEEAIMAPIDAALARWRDATVVLDPHLGGDFLAARIDSAYPRARVAVFNQVATALSRAAAAFTEQLAAGRLEHPDDEALTAHVLAAVAQPVGEGLRFRKDGRHGRPVDALIALVMALHVLAAEPVHGRAAWA